MEKEIKYFRVITDSAEYCGFQSFGYFASESEKELQKDQKFLNFIEESEDNLLSFQEEEEENLSVSIEEITKEEYDEFMEDYDEERPYD